MVEGGVGRGESSTSGVGEGEDGRRWGRERGRRHQLG
jgi:hypothetical protein